MRLLPLPPSEWYKQPRLSEVEQKKKRQREGQQQPKMNLIPNVTTEMFTFFFRSPVGKMQAVGFAVGRRGSSIGAQA